MSTVTVVTATRAEYGLLRPVVQKLASCRDLSLSLVVTGAHLCARLGATVAEIEADGLPIAARLPIFAEEPGEPVARAIARTMEVFDGYFAAPPPRPAPAAGRPVRDLRGGGGRRGPAHPHRPHLGRGRDPGRRRRILPPLHHPDGRPPLSLLRR